jgi:hypothetical protein
MPRVKISAPTDGAVRCLAVYRLSDRVLVAMYTPANGAERTCRELISKILNANASAMHPRLTVTDRENGTVHYVTDELAMYVAVCAPDYPQRVAFRAIGELRARFISGLSDALPTAIEGGLSKAARPLLVELCGRYAEAATVDKTLGVQRAVDEVRDIMGESIQALLSTHDSLEVLDDRSEHLREQAQSFRKTTRAVKAQQRSKYRRMQSISCLILIVVVAAAVVPLIILHWDEIIAFLRTMLPPPRNETISGDDGSGEALVGSGDVGSGH